MLVSLACTFVSLDWRWLLVDNWTRRLVDCKREVVDRKFAQLYTGQLSIPLLTATDYVVEALGVDPMPVAMPE